MHLASLVSVFLLVVVLVSGTSQDVEQEGLVSRKARQITDTFKLTVRRLLRVIVDGMKDLYSKIGVLSSEVKSGSKKHDSLEKMVIDLSERLNLTIKYIKKNKKATEKKIKDSFVETMERLEESRIDTINATMVAVQNSKEILEKKIMDTFMKMTDRLEESRVQTVEALENQEVRFSEAIANLNKNTDENKLALAQLQTEIVEGTYVINQTIYNIPRPNEGEVRVVGGGARGQVEVHYLGDWSLICDDEWTVEDALVVCRMLGYTSNVAKAYQEPVNREIGIKMDKVVCAGYEQNLASCPHIGTFLFHACPNNTVAAVDCEPSENPLSNLLLNAMPLEAGVSKGKEISPKPSQKPAPLSQTRVQSKVPLPTKPVSASQSKPSSKPPTKPSSEPHSSNKTSSKPLASVAEVTTKKPKLQTKIAENKTIAQKIEAKTTVAPASGTKAQIGKLLEGLFTTRLVGGGTGSIGRLEVYHNGVWGTVCEDRFDDVAARVVCASLNLPSKQATFYKGSQYPLSDDIKPGTPMWLDEVVCDGSELSIFSCKHSEFGQNDCGPTENVGVMCA